MVKECVCDRDWGRESENNKNAALTSQLEKNGDTLSLLPLKYEETSVLSEKGAQWRKKWESESGRGREAFRKTKKKKI